MVSRGYVFTLNNYTDEEVIGINDLINSTEWIRYIIYGKEIGEKNGTPHLQGYIELSKGQRISALSKLKGFGRAHFEKRLGNRDEARKYCMKDMEFFEFGCWEAGGQGARNDIRKIMNMIKDPTLTREDAMEADPLTYSKHMRFFNEYRSICERNETRDFRQVETDVFIGEAGTGKSRTAREIDRDAFVVSPECSFPFDGYDGEATIIIDDFDGSGIMYKHLLKILDGHQHRVNIKGGHRYAKWNRVIITTNEEPSSWYRHGLTKPLERRLTRVTRFPSHEVGGNSDAPTPLTDILNSLEF